MGSTSSKIATGLGRLVKAVMVVVLLPLVVGLLLGILGQLELVPVSETTARELITVGFVTYVGAHILLYRPVSLFRASHRVFAAMAVWLFGGQVTSVEGQRSGGDAPKGRGKGKGDKGTRGESGPQGSTLVAFSPYVIPSYMALVCVLAWALTRWVDPVWIDRPALVLVGVTIAFHWLMTADELQQQRARWHIETYLLAISLVFVVTLLIGGACLPLAAPEFSFVRALSDGIIRTQAIYSTMLQEVFF